MENFEKDSFFIVGGAGFIGSHFTDFLLQKNTISKVTLYDNFSSGKEWHYEHHSKDPRLFVVKADVKDLNLLTKAMQNHNTVIHLASNPDIAKAAVEPDIDFREGTFLTNNVVEAMRLSGVRNLLYASGSGVYGDLGEQEAFEDYGPKTPISTYGASKLAGEVLIASYCYMFNFKASAFRFANVVGSRQTHGIGYDFVRRLSQDSSRLRVLGDGTQSKSYCHVSDIVSGVLTVYERQTKNFDVYNIATGDYITVNQIADLAIECLALNKASVKIEYTGGNRGWKGDVPIIRMSSDKIRQLGWKNSMNCKEALKASIQMMLKEVKK